MIVNGGSRLGTLGQVEQTQRNEVFGSRSMKGNDVTVLALERKAALNRQAKIQSGNLQRKSGTVTPPTGGDGRIPLSHRHLATHFGFNAYRYFAVIAQDHDVLGRLSPTLGHRGLGER